MYTYIKNSVIGKYFETDDNLSLIDGYAERIGTTWEDFINGKFILLSPEQLSFRAENPIASVIEVFNMRIDTPIVEPGPERTLDDAKNELHEAIDEYAKTLQAFYVNEQPVWFDDRPSLKLQIDAEAMYNSENVTLYDSNGNAYTLPIDQANDAILAVEHYNTQVQDMIQELHAQVETIPSLEFADNINIDDFTQNAPSSPEIFLPGYVPQTPQEPENPTPTAATYSVTYKTANCGPDNDFVTVEAGGAWKTTVYPDYGLAILRTDFVAEMGGVPLTVVFGDDMLNRPEYASNAYIYVENVTGDIFVAGIAY